MKRYQVFLSSAYQGLAAERLKLSLALITRQFMPMGMEAFSATDRPTWDYIKACIEESDLYVLVIGDETGSLFPGSDQSWTEREYDHALSLGMKPLYFPKRPFEAKAHPETARFRQKVELSGSGRIWTSEADLVSGVLNSLQDRVRENPKGGWVRAAMFLDDEGSMLEFSRRSTDYDMTGLIEEGGDVRILINDGYSWFKRYQPALRRRFLAQPAARTLIAHVSEHSPQLDYIAGKSMKSVREQQADIRSMCEDANALARECGYDRLELVGHGLVNTHCLFMNNSSVIVTPYFSSKNRFLDLPLYRYKANSELYRNYLQDFELIYRDALAGK